jgi:hypothetical protein
MVGLWLDGVYHPRTKSQMGFDPATVCFEAGFRPRLLR